MTDSIRPPRENGLSPPYTPAQVSTWVFLPTLVLEFLLVVAPLLPLVPSIIFTIIFCSLAGAAAGYAFMAMKIDPSDPRLLDSQQNNNQGSRWNPQDPTKQCWICDVQVGVKSMHCKFCNKCVDHFDHHCMWLNTCIGKANYGFFFRTMVCINMMLFVQAAIQIALFVDFFVGNGDSKERAENWFSVGTYLPVLIIMGVFIFFDIAALSLIGQLLIFHLKLQKEGISTYEYIVRDNQKRREIKKKTNDLKARRQTAITTAKEEGNRCLVVRLENGGFLRENCGIVCCDPLSLDDMDSVNQTNDANGTSSNRKFDDV